MLGQMTLPPPSPLSSSSSSRIPTPQFDEFRKRWLASREATSPLGPAEREVIVLSSGDESVRSLRRLSPAVNKSGRSALSQSCPPTPASPRGRRAHRSASALGADRAPTQPLAQPKPKQARNRAQALTEVSVLIDDRLCAKYADAPLAALQQQTAAVAAVRLFADNAVLWTRDTLCGRKASGFVLLLFDAQDVIVSTRPNDAAAIKRFLVEQRQLVPPEHSRLFLAFVGGRAAATRLAAAVNKQFRQCVKNGERLRITPTKIQSSSWPDIEQLLWIAGIEEGIHVQFIDRPEQLGEHLVHFTKSVAWEPHARRHEAGNFCTLTTKRCGATLTETWRRFLEEIGRVTPITADAIVSQYPTLDSLLSQYLTMEPPEAATLLANIQVGARALGPALSRRIHAVLTSRDAHQLVNL